MNWQKLRKIMVVFQHSIVNHFFCMKLSTWLMAFCLVILHTQLYDEEGKTLWHSVVKFQQCNGDNAKFYTTYITSNAAISRDHSLNAIEETWYKINGNWLRKSKYLSVEYSTEVNLNAHSNPCTYCAALRFIGGLGRCHLIISTD